MEGMNPASKLKFLGFSKKTWEDLLKAINITQPNKQMTWSSTDEELGLFNPYSKVTCFFLYLYSLEFGDPPLYSELNRICRDQDLHYINTLGPFALAMVTIILNAENKREPTDKI